MAEDDTDVVALVVALMISCHSLFFSPVVMAASVVLFVEEPFPAAAASEGVTVERSEWTVVLLGEFGETVGLEVW